MFEPSEELRLSTERQNERYRHVRYWHEDENKELTPGYYYKPGWYAFCCGGCHGCCGVPISGPYPRPIDAHLARKEWLEEIPVGPVRIVDSNA